MSSFSVLICEVFWILKLHCGKWKEYRSKLVWSGLIDCLFLQFFNFFLSSDIKPNMFVPISCCFANMHQSVFHVVKYTVSHVQQVNMWLYIQNEIRMSSAMQPSKPIESRDIFSVICKADIFSKKKDIFSAKVQYMQKYPSHNGLILWLVLMTISFAYSWPNWRHQPLIWWGLSSVRRTAAYYKGYVQHMLPQVWEGPSSGAGGRMVVTEYCDHSSHQYNSFLTLS